MTTLPARPPGILVIDDNPSTRKMVRMALEGEGYTVFEAEDGRSALDLMAARRPDLILQDLLLPDFVGVDLVQRLRTLPGGGEVPILAVSGFLPGPEQARSSQAGFTDYVFKPVEPSRLVETVRTYLIGSLSHRLTVLEAQIAVFAGLSEILKKTSDVETVLGELLHRCLDAAGVSRGAVYLLDPDGRLSLQCQLGHSAPAEAALQEFFGHPHLLHSIMHAGEPACITLPELRDEIRTPAHPHSLVPACAPVLLDRAEARSILITPLVLGTERLGVLVMASGNRDLSAEWIPFAQALGSQMSQAIVLTRALSQRKLLEEQFRQAQKMEAVGRLASGVAHDFNNMIGAITGYADILLHRLAPDESVQSALQEIMKAADRAANLTRQLLLFSRKEAPLPQVLDLNGVLAEIHRMLRRLIDESIELVTLPDSSAGHIKADEGQIEQVLLNLVVNARDAMPEGGKLVIQTRRVEAGEAALAGLPPRPGDPPGGWTLLEVGDSGCGMDAETQSRIFEPFFTTKGAGKGTGLGLATVYAIVEQAGGQIRVDTAPGQGTTFRIYLPQTEEDPVPEQPVDALVAPSPGSGTILLAEDEPMMQRLVRTTLEASGYTVLEALQGHEALRLCQQHEGAIDLLVTDIVMPGMGGRELAERAVALRPGLKVLFMSGYTDDSVIRSREFPENTSFIQKPFKPAALAQKIHALLE